MAERSGKVGAFYAVSGTGHLVTAESGTLSSNAHDLDHKNVIVTNVYKNKSGGGGEFYEWTCTPMGHLVIPKVTATATFSITYRWYSEEGEPWADTGAIKKYGGFFNWSIDNTADVLDITDFSDLGHRNFIACLDGWSGTAERFWVDSGLKTYMGSKIIAKFYVDDDSASKGTASDSDTGKRYEGFCFITGISPSTAVDTLVNESLSFQGTGQIVFDS